MLDWAAVLAGVLSDDLISPIVGRPVLEPEDRRHGIALTGQGDLGQYPLPISRGFGLAYL